jgi:4-hydroxybutyrate CoA-transferase
VKVDTKNWQSGYEKKYISAEKAANLIKSGDRICFTMGREAYAIGLAIASRKEELKDITVFVPSPGYDFGWYDPGWDDTFSIKMYMVTATSQQILDDRRCDLEVSDILFRSESNETESDIVITEVSSPDDKGFCSFGASLWDKRRQIRKGKLVLAEVNRNLIRTFGDNYVHVSEIDYFVEHQSADGAMQRGSLAGREIKKPPRYLKDIAGHISGLIRDGDTCQMGVGRTIEPLVKLGLFDNKRDLGWHSEATPDGVIQLVREGVINGKYKTINRGKVVVTSLGGAGKEDMDWVNGNPLFHLVDVEYLWDPRTISAHDNMVAINNALCVDITGQSSAETVGGRIFGTQGGQPSFVIGALLSKGGRSIIVLPSTAEIKGKTVSRIIPKMEEGIVVTVPRYLADYVVTEYGVAHLRGKTLRHRAEELIAIAHPDFRGELKKEAQKMFWP